MYCPYVGWGFKFGQVEGCVDKRIEKSVEVEGHVRQWIKVEGHVHWWIELEGLVVDLEARSFT